VNPCGPFLALLLIGLALEVMDHAVAAVLAGEDFDTFDSSCYSFFLSPPPCRRALDRGLSFMEVQLSMHEPLCLYLGSWSIEGMRCSAHGGLS
jgi:hypothetical protein